MLLLLTFNIITISLGFTQKTNPCPDIFQYKQDESGLRYGLITLPQSKTETGKIILNVLFSISGVHPSKYSGHLKLINTKDEILNIITSNGRLKYKLYFPFTTSLPQIRKIIQNNQLLCEAPAQFGLFTEFSLEHTLTLVPEKPRFNPLNNLGTAILDPSLFSRTPREFITVPTVTPPALISNFLESSEEEQINATCGKATMANPLVLGGVETKRGMFPWLAVIYRRTTSQLNYLCGGSLITNKHILTAAHCMKGPTTPLVETEELIVHLGRYNLLDWLEPGAIITEVDQISIHPDYGQKQFYYYSDIAIIKLTNKIEFNQFIRPICMSFDQSLGEMGYVVGWGRNSSTVANKPQMVKMPIVSQETCLRSNEGFYYFTSNTTFCAGNRDGSGPCNGDSGTGMYILDEGRYYIRGLVSLSLQEPVTRSCDLKNYAVFTDLNSFKSWILNIIN